MRSQLAFLFLSVIFSNKKIYTPMTQNSQSTDRHVDIAVIGAGIAGISLAAFLSPHARVLLVEQDSTRWIWVTMSWYL